MIVNIIILVALISVAAVLLSPAVRASSRWRATVTPLASIIGSGFLVSLPILTAVVGSYAIVAMTLLIVAAYLLGAAIRFNIVHGEPLFVAEHGQRMPFLERMSHFALAMAYFVSVTYYLSLLSAFVLKAIGMQSEVAGQAITTVLLIAIGVYGLKRGLRGLESVEEYAVGLKLAVIAAVLAGLLVLNVRLLSAGDWAIGTAPVALDWDSVRVVLGLLIVVQGFETSRFLAGEYPPDLRVSTMRSAQIWSGLIYVAFFALALPISAHHPADGDVAAVIDLVAVAAPILPLLLAAGAAFAQLSAAVADAIGSAGLIHEESNGRVDRNLAYPVIAVIGIALLWATDVFAIIALASRAFALFYCLQCIVAAQVALRAPQVRYRHARAAGFVLLAIVAFGVVVFGIPVEGGE